MNRFNSRAALAGVLCVLAAGQVEAQFQRPGPANPTMPPVFSPYLNMLRADSPAAINYFGLVRPQITAQARFGALQQELMMTQLQQQQQGMAPNDLPVSGQAAFFLNTGGYFLNYQVGTNTGGNRMQFPQLPGGRNTILRPNNSALPYRQ
jgi:hypothetical protein